MPLILFIDLHPSSGIVFPSAHLERSIVRNLVLPTAEHWFKEFRYDLIVQPSITISLVNMVSMSGVVAQLPQPSNATDTSRPKACTKLMDLSSLSTSMKEM